MKQTRANRKKAKRAANTPDSTEPNGPEKSGKSNPEKIYYSIIAILLVVLVGIMVFIFMNRDTGVDLNADNESPGSDIVTDLDEEEEEETESDEDVDADVDEETDSADTEEETDTDTEEEPADDEEAGEDQPDEETDTEVDQEETEEESESDTEESDVEVTENAPLDESYTVNYNEGSGDRVAIANAVSSVTGLNQSDMITWRVGNDGPGRVFAVTSDSGRSNVYRVLLQYGDGQWHVTSVEELADVPAEFR